MSRYVDAVERVRLERENEYLYEQVRTLSAELAGRHRADWLIVKNGERDVRPAYETAAGRVLLADEVVTNDNTMVFALETLRRAIEAHAKLRQPLDYIWRLTMERDYRA